MAKNIEIKAVVHDPAQFRKVAEALSGAQKTLVQEDTFFNTPTGRLKLRRFPEGPAQLIYYERADRAGPKSSSYWITETADGKGMQEVLSRSLGVLGVVKKVRHLFLIGQTRIHLDEVDGLGTFAELEVVLVDQSAEQGVCEANELMKKLAINEQDLIERAYIDLLLR